MKPRIVLTKLGGDEELIELELTVCDGNSSFTSRVYLGCDGIKQILADLNDFKNQVYGGVYDITMGKLGLEYASGAFQVRLHFYTTGKLFISTLQQTAFFDFAHQHVAAEAKMYLCTEPALFDSFITRLKMLENGTDDEAVLECI